MERSIHARSNTHTGFDSGVRQGSQTQTLVSSLGSDHKAKVYSLTPVTLYKHARIHTKTHIHTQTNPLTSQANTERGILKSGGEKDDGGWVRAKGTV